MRCRSWDQPLISRHHFAEMLLLAFWRGLGRFAAAPDAKLSRRSRVSPLGLSYISLVIFLLAKPK